MTDQGERFVVVVRDAAPTVPAPAAPAGPPGPGAADGPDMSQSDQGVPSAEDGALAIPAGFGLAVISGLADDVRVSSTSSGVSVRMSWPSAAAPA